MTIDDTALAGMRATLAADDYQLTVDGSGPGVEVRITAGPAACADCLVPKPLMRRMLGSVLGVAEEQIVLVYPAEAG